MTLVQTLPILAALLFVGVNSFVSVSQRKVRGVWVLVALSAALFFALSLAAVLHEGPVGFWSEHTHSLWGNQIWFDLLLAASIAWAMLAPQARSLWWP